MDNETYLPSDIGLKGLYNWSSPGKRFNKYHLLSVVLPQAHHSDIARLIVYLGDEIVLEVANEITHEKNKRRVLDEIEFILELKDESINSE